MTASAKICGLTTPEAVEAALAGGASHLGFVFFARSPRSLSPAQAAELAGPARGEARIVAVTVDAFDEELAAIAHALEPDLIQLHGHETPARAREVKALTGAGVIKALQVSGSSDLEAAQIWEAEADHLMFDARPPKGSELPGGLGARFDWAMLEGLSFRRPWFLAGGLNPENVGEAVAASGAPLVDVSSGVEFSPGLKDPALIAAFLQAVQRIR
jgi:phosphoribosylanthranilate isomerase